MKITARTGLLVVAMMMALTGCSTHCTCPPQTPPTTTVIHDHSPDY